MKRRNGWVSNSSSSSFVLDTDLSIEDIRKILKKLISALNIARPNHKFPNLDKAMCISVLTTASAAELRRKCRDWNYSTKYDAWNKDESEFKSIPFHKGLILIEENKDNSIHHIVYEVIEDVLNGTNFRWS